jgi:hypothetical protein
MSGYLQRLASSVLNPSGPTHSVHSIHPVLTPIYSPSGYAGDGEDLREQSVVLSSNRPETRVAREENIPAAAQPEAVTPPAARILPEAEAESHPSISSHTPAFESPAVASPRAAKSMETEPIAEDRTPFKPLLKRAQQEDLEIESPALAVRRMGHEGRGVEEPEEVPTRNGPDLAKQRLEPLIVDIPRSHAATSAFIEAVPQDNVGLASEKEIPVRALASRVERSDTEESSVVIRDRYVPLVAEHLQRVDAPTIFAEVPKPAIPGARKETNRNSSPWTKPPEREPDEIQIHIGRIEVTAVPPPPARPAAKPTRTTLSLDDYLKRRHGRT